MTELVGTQTAAEALGISRTTLWRAFQQGRLTPHLITPGGQPRWDLDDLRRQLAPPSGRPSGAPPLDGGAGTAG